MYEVTCFLVGGGWLTRQFNDEQSAYGFAIEARLKEPVATVRYNFPPDPKAIILQSACKVTNEIGV